MSLDKAIQHGKEKRKQCRGAKAVDPACRNHGDSCPDRFIPEAFLRNDIVFLLCQLIHHHAGAAQRKQLQSIGRLPPLKAEQLRAKAQGKFDHADAVLFRQKKMKK